MIPTNDDFGPFISQNPDEALFQSVPGNYYGETNISGGTALLGNNYGSITFSSPPRFSSFITRSLWFPEMNSRHNDIKVARHDTYTWIFEEISSQPDALCNKDECFQCLTGKRCSIQFRKHKASEIRQWLRIGTGMYLISGKAGAGKSTFMKFLYEHPSTLGCLELSGRTPSLLFHSFWRLGRQLQCSYKGFLASMLFQILESQPDICESYENELQGLFCKHSINDWSESGLRSFLVRVLDKMSTFVCVFVDGMDELHPDDNLHDLVQLLTEMSTMANCKVCVSSRPLQSITGLLQDVQTTKLPDLTQRDICRYIQGEMEMSRAFTSCEITDSELSALVDLLSSKADGVFIWVYLVVKDIRHGILLGDDFSMLEQRVKIMPSKIEELFLYMLSRSRSDRTLYTKKASLIFSFGEYFPMSLLRLATATDVVLCDSLLIENRRQSLSELEELCRRFARHINASCAGLLECVMPPSDNDGRISAKPGSALRSSEPDCILRLRVQYIHRSVHDFLSETMEGQKLLEARLQRSQIQLGLVKSALVCLNQGIYDLTDHYVSTICSYYLADAGTEVAPVVGMIEKICSNLTRTTSLRSNQPKPDWYHRIQASTVPRFNKQYSEFHSWWPRDFPRAIYDDSSVICMAYLLQAEGRSWSKYYKGYLALLRWPRDGIINHDELIRARDQARLMIDSGADMMTNQSIRSQGVALVRPPAIDYLAVCFICALTQVTGTVVRAEILGLIHPFVDQMNHKLFSVSVTYEESDRQIEGLRFDPRCGGKTTYDQSSLVLTFRVIDVLSLLQDLRSDYDEKRQRLGESERDVHSGRSHPDLRYREFIFAKAFSQVQQIHVVAKASNRPTLRGYPRLIPHEVTKSLREATLADIASSRYEEALARMLDTVNRDSSPYSIPPPGMYPCPDLGPYLLPRPVHPYGEVDPAEWEQYCTMRAYLKETQSRFEPSHQGELLDLTAGMDDTRLEKRKRDDSIIDDESTEAIHVRRKH